jgi:hypothetical protein
MHFNFKKMRDDAAGLVRRAGAEFTRLTRRRQAAPAPPVKIPRPPRHVTNPKKAYGPGLRDETRRLAKRVRRAINERNHAKRRLERLAMRETRIGRFSDPTLQAHVRLMTNLDRTRWARAGYPTEIEALETYSGEDERRHFGAPSRLEVRQ